MKTLSQHYYSEIFTKASEASSIKDLEKLVNENLFLQKSIEDFRNKYPDINLSISRNEVEDAIQDDVLTNEHLLQINRRKPFSTLEKLLIAVVWKNGHITRVQSVVDGIIGETKSKSDYGLIFRQFGKSLAYESEPIVDQHVLRAFHRFFYLKTDASKKFPDNRALNNSDECLVNNYCAWFKGIISKVPKQEQKLFCYQFDKILFAIGKAIKGIDVKN